MTWWPWSLIRRRRAPVVPVLRLAGTIGAVPFRGGGLTLKALAEDIERAFSIKRAKTVALVINSPGGSPVQSSLIAGRIRQLAEENDKEVVAFVEDVAASGGYWLACAADEIFIDQSSIVGSIGVVSAGFGFSEAIAKLGIERRVYTAGTRKALLDPFKPENPEDLAILRELQGEIHGAFKAQIKDRRGERLGDHPEELFDGRIWVGQKAIDAGLADGIGDLRSVARQRFGDEVRLIAVNREKGWLARRIGAEAIADACIQRIEDRLRWQGLGF